MIDPIEFLIFNEAVSLLNFSIILELVHKNGKIVIQMLCKPVVIDHFCCLLLGITNYTLFLRPRFRDFCYALLFPHFCELVEP